MEKGEQASRQFCLGSSAAESSDTSLVSNSRCRPSLSMCATADGPVSLQLRL
jgi:hypothetical protein